MQYLKVMLAMLLVGLLALPAMAGLVVTPNDVQIMFPKAIDTAWVLITASNISYFAGPPGAHNPKAKLGIQTWQGLIQEDQPELGSVEFQINVIALPSMASGAPARDMDLRFRVREIKSDTTEVDGPWGDYNEVTIIGKPGQPAQQ